MIVTLILLVLIFALAVGLPVAFALILSGALGLYLIGGMSVVTGIMATTPAASVSSYELIAVPMFILMAEFMIVSGIADDMFEVVGRLMRRLPGGLAVATALSGAAFGAVSGSSTAAAATLSASSVPTMIRQGYNPAFASGVVAISGTLAMLIPPSIALILYGLLSGANIAALLKAAMSCSMGTGLSSMAEWSVRTTARSPTMAPSCSTTGAYRATSAVSSGHSAPMAH